MVLVARKLNTATPAQRTGVNYFLFITESGNNNDGFAEMRQRCKRIKNIYIHIHNKKKKLFLGGAARG